MKKTLLLIVLAAAVPALACAKKPKKDAPQQQAVEQTVEEDPVITEDCLRNLSIVHENVKSKQFEEALEPWLQVYTQCPNANKSIYTNGAKIVDYFYEKASTPQEKKRWAELSLELCDKRIRWFGDDPKYPAAYILGEKGLAYCDHFPEDELKEAAYPWFKESIDALKENSKISVLVKFIEISYNLYRTDNDKYAEQYMADNATVSGYLQTMADDEENKNATVASQQKDYVDNLFAVSGAAECSKLDEMYAGYINNNLSNLDNLSKVIKLYKRVGCTESDVYFAAAEAAHKLKPEAESAAGCARMCVKKEDWDGAIAYFQEAIDLLDADNIDDRADYYYTIALISMDKFKNYADARVYAHRSLEVKPSQGRCYMLIGYCYAASKPYRESEYPASKCAILNKTVFWAAVDKFQKAKEVDSSCADEANKQIAIYSKYFPTKEEMFDLPKEFSGGTFTVGGWINERTVCRPAK